MRPDARQARVGCVTAHVKFLSWHGLLQRKPFVPVAFDIFVFPSRLIWFSVLVDSFLVSACVHG